MDGNVTRNKSKGPESQLILVMDNFQTKGKDKNDFDNIVMENWYFL